jgi:O-antigen/teichoic acid export membrane protein
MMVGAIYSLSALASRVLVLATMVLVTHLLSSEELGAYVLSVTTAFALSYLFGSWLSASAYRFIPGSSANDQDLTISCLAAGLLIAFCLSALFIFSLYKADFLILSPLDIFLMCCFVASMMIFDVTMALNNSMGKVGAFALAGIIRNTTTFILVLVTAGAGFGLEGALTAQVMGVIAGLATRSTLRIWGRFHSDRVLWQRLREFIVYGSVGGIVLGYYMISQAISRNIVSREVDIVSAGIFGVSFDLMLGSIAVVGTILSYIHMPKMHEAGRHKSRMEMQSSTTEFLNLTIIFTTPFVFGGVLVGGELLRLVIGGNIGSGSATIAPYAVVYAGAISVFSAVIGALLAGHHLVVLLVLVLGSLFTSGLALFWAAQSADIVLIAQVSAAMITLFMFVALWFGRVTGTAKLSGSVFFKSLGLSIVMALAIGELMTFPQPYGLLLAIFIGLGIYVAGMEASGLFPVLGILSGLLSKLAGSKASQSNEGSRKLPK